MTDQPRIPPVNMGKAKLPCKRHRKAGLIIEACPDCNRNEVTVLRHTDHARKRHVDVPVYRKTWKENNKYSPTKKEN